MFTYKLTSASLSEAALTEGCVSSANRHRGTIIYTPTLELEPKTPATTANFGNVLIQLVSPEDKHVGGFLIQRY